MSLKPRDLLLLFSFVVAIVATLITPSALAASSTVTTLSVTSGGSPVSSVVAGSVVTLTAKVKGGATAVKPGQVKFCDAFAAHCTDIHLIATAQLTATAGVATYRFIPGVGSHSYKAVFVGTGSAEASSSAASALTVTSSYTGTYPSVTTIEQSGSQGNFTLTATVAGIGGAGITPSPTGVVSFLEMNNGNASLPTAVLESGPPGLNWVNSWTEQGIQVSYSVVVADFNGDGIPDLATTDYFNGILDVFLGNGDGTFRLSAQPAVGFLCTSVATGDFNQDGNADLAIAWSNSFDGSSGVAELIGNGDGTFRSAWNVSVGSRPSFVATGDFNGDGHPDLVVADQGSKITILLGRGDGSFLPSAFNGGSGNIAVADLNGDGIPDLARTDGTVLLGNGEGIFTAAPNFVSASVSQLVTGPVPIANIVAGDFNGDGKMDLAVPNPNGNVVKVYLGNGDGTFTPAASPITGDGPNAVTELDANNDGIADLAVTNQGRDSVSILLGNGDGTFSAGAVSPSTGFGPDFIVAADFNGDGAADLAVVNYSADSQNSDALTVFLAQPTQIATATASGITLTGTQPSYLVYANYPGDSYHDSSESGTTSLLVPLAKLAATSLSFDAQNINTTSDTQTVNLFNGGDAALNITSMKLTGAHPSQYLTSNNCGSILQSGSSCTIKVRFRPTIAGDLAAALTITDNDSDSPQSIQLIGTGNNGPLLSLSASSLDFGTQAVNTESPAQTVTMTNTGLAPLDISGIAVSGSHPGQYLTSNNCPGSLAVSGSCDLRVRFRPYISGLLPAVIVISYNGVDSPKSIALTGKAQ